MTVMAPGHAQRRVDRPAPCGSVDSRRCRPPSRFEPRFRRWARFSAIGSSGSTTCRVEFVVDINTRPTRRVLGGYYKSRRLVRVYSHDRGRPAARWKSCSTPFCTRSRTTSSTPSRQSFGSPGCRASRPDAQPAVLADPGRAEVALGRAQTPGVRMEAAWPRCPENDPDPSARSHCRRVPDSLSLAATSAPALSTLTALSMALMIPSLSM